MSDTQDASDHAAVDLWRNLAEAERARADRLAAALRQTRASCHVSNMHDGTFLDCQEELCRTVRAALNDYTYEAISAPKARAALADVREPAGEG